MRLPTRRRHLTEDAVLLLRLLLCVLRHRRRLSRVGQPILMLLMVRLCGAEEAVTVHARRQLQRARTLSRS